MNSQSDDKWIEMALGLPRAVDGTEKGLDSDRLHAIAAAFVRKLIGVEVRQDIGCDGTSVVIAIRGGADHDYVERLWSRYLQEQGMAAPGRH